MLALALEEANKGKRSHPNEIATKAIKTQMPKVFHKELDTKVKKVR